MPQFAMSDAKEGMTVMPLTDTWRIERNAPEERAYAALATDRRWNGYSIADLAPATRAWTRVAIAVRGGEAGAACLFYGHPAFNSLIPHGDPAGVAAILTDAAAGGLLPAATYVLAQEQHLPALAEHYHFPHGRGAMLRMAVDRASFTPPTDEPSPASRLGGADLAPLSALYEAYPDSAFTDDQLAHGVFYGVREGGAIVAAGGTHVVAAEYGLAAVGNIFVAPVARGRGLGGAVTAAIVGELLAGPCGEVILNVAADNAAAQKIYRRLGFVPHCPYSEASAVLRQHSAAPVIRHDNAP